MEAKVTNTVTSAKEARNKAEKGLKNISQLAGESYEELRRSIRAVRDDFDLTETTTKMPKTSRKAAP